MKRTNTAWIAFLVLLPLIVAVASLYPISISSPSSPHVDVTISDYSQGKHNRATVIQQEILV